MTVKLLTKPHLRFLSLKGGCTGSSASIHVKMPHCWKSHVTAQLSLEDLTEVVVLLHNGKGGEHLFFGGLH